MPRWMLLATLIRRKFWPLVATGVLGTLLCYGAAWLIPERFQATATIVIDPAIQPSVDDEAPQFQLLSVPTATKLMTQNSTTALVKDVIVGIRGGQKGRPGDLVTSITLQLDDEDVAAISSREHPELDDVTVEVLQKWFEATPTIEKKLAFDVIYSPFVQMEVTAGSPELARALANVWSTTFVTTFERLLKRQATSNARVVAAAYAETERAWASRLKEVETLTIESQLPVVKATIDELALALGETQRLLLEAIKERDLARAQFDQVMTEQTFLMDENGRWVGSVRDIDEAQDPGPAPAPETDIALPEHVKKRLTPQTETLHRQLRQATRLSAWRLRSVRHAWTKFSEGESVEGLEARIENERQQLQRIGRRLSELEGDVPAQRAALAALGDLDTSSSERSLDARQQLSRLEAEQTALLARQKSGSEALTKMEHDASLARRRQDQYKLESETIETQHTELQRRYLDLTNRAQELTQLGEDAAVRAKALEEQVASMKKNADADLKKLSSAENRIAVLESQAESDEEQATELKVRLHELELTLAEESQEIKVAAQARTPEEKTFPPRTLIALAGGCMAGMLHLVLLYLGLLWRRNEQSDAR